MSRYILLIQTEPRKDYRRLVGWDECFESKKEAELCAQHARALDWHDVKVVEVCR